MAANTVGSSRSWPLLLAAQRQSGERSWRNHHYLRGSIYCADCAGRLFFIRASGNGGKYDYFVCGGRHRQTCSQPYHRAEAIEYAIERHYATIQFTPAQRERVRTAVHAHVDRIAALADTETNRARAEITRLTNEERKLLSAHYSDKISDDLFAEEQMRIRRERIAANELLRRYEVKTDDIRSTLDLALDLTDNIQTAYRQADTTERRLFNQAFFERLEISSEDVDDHILKPLFAQLTTIAAAAPQQPAKPESPRKGRPEPARSPESPDGAPGARQAQKAKTPAILSNDEGSHLTLMVEPSGLEPLTSWVRSRRSPS